ncbi:ras guanine nucleotide exchange factor domain-containing protein [Catenaria anguillulae PL171]|uniref:Ras guanine nucleotide exchange factor domain-containing protein n=1 Tax=Catenaria anguillulae PL171 TaxID=765915 RepID=A0A1Y2I1K8_9FUNG|nr:ras guanine nucleotide exchange factor domain-containing protein [Catenaria anguillulae PL171]
MSTSATSEEPQQPQLHPDASIPKSPLTASQQFPSGPILNHVSPWEEPKQCRLRIHLPQGQTTVVQVDFAKTMTEILTHICSKRSLEPAAHTLLIQFMPDDKGVEPPLVRADPNRRLDQYSDWKSFVVASNDEALNVPPLVDAPSMSMNNLAIASRGAGGRRRSIINAPTSKNVTVRLDTEEFPRTISDAAEIEARMERTSRGHAMGTGDSPTKKSGAGTLRAISTMLLRRPHTDTGSPNLSASSTEDISAISPTPSSGVMSTLRTRLTSSNGPSEKPTSASSSRATNIDSASREGSGSFSSEAAPGGGSLTPIRTSRPRTSNGSKYVTLRKSPTSSPTRTTGLQVPDAVHTPDVVQSLPFPLIIDSGPGATTPQVATLPPLISVTVTLPSMINCYCKVGEEVTMEQLLSHVCAKQKLSFSQFTLEIVASTIVIELDRTIKYYLDKEKVTSFNLVSRAKSYNTICVCEGDQDVLIVQCQEGRYVQKLIELLTINTDLYDMVKLPKPTKPSGHAAPTYALSPRRSPSSTGSTHLSGSDISLDHDYDFELLDTFLMTYRSFMKPVELFERLVAQFNADLPDNATAEDLEFFDKNKLPTQIRSVQALGIWVDHYWNDFALNTDLKNDLENFLAEICQFSQFRDLSLAVQEIIEFKTEEYERVLSEHKLATQKSKTMESMILEYTPLQVAQQLCLYNWRLFRNIHPIEYLHHIWTKRTADDDSHSPSLDYFIARFDLESYWVATEICMVKDPKKRAAVLSQFIEIAQHCLSMNNFFSTFSLISGLGLRPVERLKKSWKLLSPEDQAKYDELVKVCDPSRNMKNYRDRLAAAKPPIVPFLPIYLKDLTFLNDGNPSSVRGLINFDKLRMMSRRVQEIVLSRGTRYDIANVNQVQNYLKKPPAERDLSKLKEMSNELEPPTK